MAKYRFDAFISQVREICRDTETKMLKADKITISYDRNEGINKALDDGRKRLLVLMDEFFPQRGFA